jgi:hypothetical protein
MDCQKGFVGGDSEISIPVLLVYAGLPRLSTFQNQMETS